jgi:tRNA(His) 5'-end guanylyltransferase
MDKRDNLGNRMKTYENVTRAHLVRRMPVIIRIDGKAFHTFTRGFKKPFDQILMKTMQDTMKYLCENIQGCVLGYTQSDEISLLLVDYQTIASDSWFDNTLQKMCSVSASMATMAFNAAWRKNVDEWGNETLPDWYEGGTNDPNVDRDALKLAQIYTSRFDKALFDARVFNVPKDDVANYFVWRQVDCTRNSIQSVGQANFSHKQLMNQSCDKIQDMLFTEKGINWNDFSTPCKRGTCCVKKPVKIGEIVRNKWCFDMEIPIFTQQPDYINQFVFVASYN